MSLALLIVYSDFIFVNYFCINNFNVKLGIMNINDFDLVIR